VSTVVVQKINILIINQSVIDLCASILAILTAVVEVDGTRMSPGSTWDQFVCRIWLTRMPLWASLGVSTYGIILTTLDRYIAVVYPTRYTVRTMLKLVVLANFELDRRRDGSHNSRMFWLVTH